ncbi:hypothetical protein [Methylotenera sp.]|uniref:hypothetical protein n=1 Tax=Methylotenera sp. TaxID=2051956 RepID=UPI002488EB26|nr:hypothetical protein [Methylotenera sp.]MDI1362577.1 hypothetical protein [Methylotenera sp.]
MKKHYVLIEFTPLHDGSVEDIPWPEVLDGAVTVTNWKNITAKSLDDMAISVGIGQVFSDTEGLSDVEIMDIISQDEVVLPEDVYLNAQYEYTDSDHILELVEEVGNGAVYEMCAFLQIDRLEIA